MAIRRRLECMGRDGRLFRDEQRARRRQRDDRTDTGGVRLVRCPAGRSSAGAIYAGEARTAEDQGDRGREMNPAPAGWCAQPLAKTERPPGIVGPDGLADVVPTTKGRFPPSAESLCTPPDRFEQFSKWNLIFILTAHRAATEAEPGRTA